MPDAKCPLCDDGSTFQVDTSTSSHKYRCSVCGSFSFDPPTGTELMDLSRLAPLARRHLRNEIRTETEENGALTLNPNIIDSILRRAAPPTVDGILDLVRAEIVASSIEAPFSSIALDLGRYPLFGSTIVERWQTR